MKLWETRFFALSQVTGEIENFRGVFIKARDITEATRAVREMQMDYLQLSGRWYKTLEDIKKEEMFLGKLNSKEVKFSKMTFDEVYDWLKGAISLEDLKEARERLLEEEGTKDYIPLVDKLIREYEESCEEDSDEEGD